MLWSIMNKLQTHLFPNMQLPSLFSTNHSLQQYLNQQTVVVRRGGNNIGLFV